MNDNRTNSTANIAGPQPNPGAWIDPRNVLVIAFSEGPRLLSLHGFHGGHFLPGLFYSIHRNPPKLVLQLQLTEPTRLIWLVAPLLLLFRRVFSRHEQKHAHRGTGSEDEKAPAPIDARKIR